MTTPAEPATGTPGAPETGSTSEPPANTGQQPATGGQENATDWATLFEGMTPQEVKKQLGFARKWENSSKKNFEELEALKAKSKQQDGEPTSDDLRQELTSEREKREAAEERAALLAYKSTVDSAAAKVGADADALRDSGSFQDAVTELLGDDFDDDDLEAAVTKVAKEYAKKPRFAKQTGPARSGADLPGGPGGLRQLTDDDLQRMSPEQIVDAQNKGLLNNLLGIT